ncbi:MAG: hypothetical protein JWQ23_1799, partial [Herminiimonas sp.]|nr:hypothetical protein [Herminiimonas sp.]
GAQPASPAPGRPPAAPTPDRVLAKQQAVPPADPAPVAAGAVAEAPVFTLDPPAAEPVSPKAAPKAARRAGEPKPSKDAAESGPREAKKTGPAPAAPEQRVAALRELPENIQREIPALTINGYIYASNPADRSVLINNRLLREGEQVAPGLTLERMQPREAIMNYRGYRYRLSY